MKKAGGVLAFAIIGILALIGDITHLGTMFDNINDDVNTARVERENWHLRQKQNTWENGSIFMEYQRIVYRSGIVVQ